MPSDLHREAKGARPTPVRAGSEAIERAVDASRVSAWVERVRSRPPMSRRIDTAALMDQVREEFGG